MPQTFCQAVDLQTVLVYHDNEVVEVMVSSEHRRPPDLTFLYFAVAEERIGTIVFLVEFRGERHSAGSGNALSERACAHINAGGALHIGMSLQHSADVTQYGQFVPVEKALERQYRIKAGAAVTFGEHKAVTILPRGILGVNVHLFEIEIRKDVCGGKRAAGMTGLCVIRAENRSHSCLGGKDLKLRDF